jgi:hypothetical protein
MSQFDYRPSYRRNLPHVQPPGAIFLSPFVSLALFLKALLRSGTDNGSG